MLRLMLPLGLIALVAVGVPPWQATPRAAEPLAPSHEAPKQGGEATVGVSSCASMACHHGNGPRGSPGSEYSTWMAIDPHARAYKALLKPESRRMHEIMAAGDAALLKQGAQRNPLCLRCHGAGDGVAESLQSDGVGCERCHGAAEKWKPTHYQSGFDRTTKGFVDLRDNLPARVESCMKCHVGDRTMEVDHDLIAAGHPRLRFEYAAYYANYPRHWVDTDLSRFGKDIEIRNWALGEVVAARSAAELLAHRAASKPNSWPEFGEYDCAACHHGLKPRTFRTDRDLALIKLDGKVRLGQLPWGTWYYPLLPTLAKQLDPEVAEKLEATRARLDAHMRKRLPPATEVHREARALANQLRAWESKVTTRRFSVRDARKLLGRLAARDQDVQAGWDGSAQVYLGLAAIYHGWTDLDATFTERSALREPLGAMRRSLAIAYPQGPKARPRYDLPANFSPTLMLQNLKQLRLLVEKQ